MSTALPTFAVVGRVNRGKSSVIASLVENDRVRISPRPGTTTECVPYAINVGGRTLLRIIDTPGFEDAPRALHWLKARETSAAGRADDVVAFVEEHEAAGEFAEECRLLRPVVDGAAVLYVVDGSEPYRPNFEAEMEILLRTGRPAMALINRSGETHLAAWKSALNQYFKVVRVFDAHRVTSEDRRELLDDFCTIAPDWEPMLRDAIAALDLEQERRLFEASTLIADLLIDSASLHLNVVIKANTELKFERRRLEGRFHDALRTLETNTHREIAEVWMHSIESWESDEPAELELSEDLFAEDTWDVMGLSPMALIGLSAVGGATAGGVIDAAVGGASLGAGILLGGLVGGAGGAFEVRRRFASASRVRDQLQSLKNAGEGGRRYRVGPHPSANFAFVLLNRAVRHLDRVLSWAHARPAPPDEGDPDERVTDELSGEARRELNSLLAKVRRKYRAVPDSLRAEVHAAVRALVENHTRAAADSNLPGSDANTASRPRTHN